MNIYEINQITSLKYGFNVHDWNDEGNRGTYGASRVVKKIQFQTAEDKPSFTHPSVEVRYKNVKSLSVEEIAAELNLIMQESQAVVISIRDYEKDSMVQKTMSARSISIENGKYPFLYLFGVMN